MASLARRLLPLPPLTEPAAWRSVLRGTLRASVSDRVALAAAGCAFFATLALFPTMSLLTSLYSLLFATRGVEGQVRLLHDLLPPPVYWLIADRLHHLLVLGPARLGVGLCVGTLLAFWSAVLGLRSMLTAIGLAYGESVRPGLWRLQATALALTLLAVLGGLLALVMLVSMPRLLSFVSPWATRMRWVHLASLTVLALFAMHTIAMLYRFGPHGELRQRRITLPGALLALLAGLGASALLTLYVDHLTTFGATYGPLAAAAGVMLWFFGSAYAVLIGAELNAQLERHQRSLV